MQPLPKYVSVIALCAAVFGALNSVEVLTLLVHPWDTVVVAGAAVFAALSHSLGGTGGR